MASLRELLKFIKSAEARRLEPIVDYLVRESVWVLGGDGWAFDIGYGGLDHVLSLDYDINVLVLDTEVYSNTGGRRPKPHRSARRRSSPRGAKPIDKKDLGLMAMNYGHVYVASIAFGARDAQTTRSTAFAVPRMVVQRRSCSAHCSKSSSIQRRWPRSPRWSRTRK